MTATPAISLPPGSRLPRSVQGLLYLTGRRRMMRRSRRRLGPVFTLNLPVIGPAVFVGDPVLARQVFAAGPSVAGKAEPNLGALLGPGSLFSLDDEPHRRRRQLLSPLFHGKRMREYEALIEREYADEAATWPENTEFSILPATVRITLNTILRAVFGADGEELAALRRLMPTLGEAGSRLAAGGAIGFGRGRSARTRLDSLRSEYDALIAKLISRALADPRLADRGDILALLLRNHYEDGEPMSHSEIADELATLLTAGNETSANTLAWTLERLRRHPDALARLVEDLNAGNDEVLQHTIWEVQRVRPVIGTVSRQVKAPSLALGEWVIPRGHRIIVSIALIHGDEAVYPDPEAFDPDRFRGSRPDLMSWLPYGGGNRRCIGSDFAETEMKVVLRCLLRDFELLPATATGERMRDRGIAYMPGKGGRVALRRRQFSPERGTAR
ncbi:cytochrome P450 [Nocardia sp. NPDC127606]|uniref:cytochrome P450 n=1 Tax=Nocardia sp. NPDC127606 TaxID=3345406 RepID=UPI0036391563